jgi:ubiquinone/menaquinone biosynthesis C-methylase UbiE
MTLTADFWNHNVHYQPVILDAVPPGCDTAVDVGCGDGRLACELAARCGAVTGIDRDERMVGLARERGRSFPTVTFVAGDFLAYPFRAEAFEFACANTALHHMDFAAALAKMARILRPGGRLAVVGLADNGSAADWIIGAAGLSADRYYKLVRGHGSSGAPVMAPAMTWEQARATAERVLPGVRYRRHLLWRYSLRWDKPGG